MLKNYIKIAWRSLTQHKSYTTINIVGLAVGMACCILIALYAKEELSYNDFHKNSDRIIAVGTKSGMLGRSLGTPQPLAEAMVNEMSAVEAAITYNNAGSFKLSREGHNFIETKNGSYAKPGFFDIFSFNLIQGNPQELLNSPNSIVLTEEVSRQLFTDGTNPVGQSLYREKRDTVQMLEVTGVVETPPHNSTLQFGAMISYNTREENRESAQAWDKFYSDHTYALLTSPKAFSELGAQFKKIAQTHYSEEDEEEPSITFFGVPIVDLHLSEISNDDGFTGNKAYLFLFGSVALFILTIACVNYINLATARTSQRSREVGVRKTLGAVREQVAGQFLGESVLLAVISFAMGMGISSFAIPYFNQLFGTSIVWEANMFFLGWLLLAAIGVGLAAGIYPALYLSGFAPISVLRDNMKQGPSGSTLRKTLVVGQFALALILIMCAIVMYKQLNYTQTKDLGFDGEQVVAVELPDNQTRNMRQNIGITIGNYSGVKEVSVVSGAPGEFMIRLGKKPQNLSPQENTPSDEPISFAPAVVDEHYLELLDIELAAGRNFSADLSTDKNSAVIISKRTAEVLGWTPEEAIGNTLNLSNESKVIGVVENFHIRSLREEVEPIVLQMSGASSWSMSGYLLARLAPDQIASTMDYIEQQIKKYAPEQPLQYEFLDEKFEAMYRTERRLARIVSLFTFIAIVIACMGLYGLSAFAAERRVKEIGIRKILGGTVSDIVKLLSKDFLKLVVLGFIIAVPLAWYIMNQWLQEFAYRIEIGLGIFAIAGGAALLIALATVSWQSVRAAVANPVDSLRSE